MEICPSLCFAELGKLKLAFNGKARDCQRRNIPSDKEVCKGVRYYFWNP